MTSTGADLQAFALLIESLTPWLDQVVIIGGWAHRLHRIHPAAQTLDYAPLTTLDADVALPIELKVEGQDIYQRLQANGFQAEFLGEHKPPSTHYHLTAERSEFYAEFLTPLVGSAHGRDGKSKGTTQLGGVRGMRQCLICERLFTPMEAAGHSMMPCKVGAVRAVRASRPDITSVMSFRAKS
jgi:hypothetical protein